MKHGGCQQMAPAGALEELAPGNTGSELRLSPRPPPLSLYLVRMRARTRPGRAAACWSSHVRV